jgi:hypothetical protein
LAKEFRAGAGGAGALGEQATILAGALVGSVAQKVVHGASVPVVAGQPVVDRIVALIDERSRLTAQRATVQ